MPFKPYANKKALNTYQSAYYDLRIHPLFDDATWTMNANKGDLDMFIDGLSNIDSSKSNIDRLKSEYTLDYADANTKSQIIYNEAFADRTVKSKPITKYDDAGNSYTETIDISDYEYNKQIIKGENEQLKQKYLDELAREYKDNQHVLVKIAGTIGSIGTSAIRGVTAGVNDIIEFLGAFAEGSVNAIANGTDWADEVGKVFASDKYRAFQVIEDLTTDFEKQYGWRDVVTGDYTNAAAAIVGGAVESLAKMAPSAALNLIAPGAGMATFYIASEFGQSYEQHYEQAVSQGLDVSYLGLMFTDAAVTGAKAAISFGFSKVLGGTSVKSTAFGMKNTAKGIAKDSTALSKYLLTIGGDMLEEGLEEVAQDSIEALTYTVLSGATGNSDYAELSKLSPEDLSITFLSAALGGLIGTNLEIAFTKNMLVSNDTSTDLNIAKDNSTNITVDKSDNANSSSSLGTSTNAPLSVIADTTQATRNTANAVDTSNANATQTDSAEQTAVQTDTSTTENASDISTPKFKKLSKIESFLLNADIKNVLIDFDKALKISKNIQHSPDISKGSRKAYSKFDKAIATAYKGVRAITSMFGEIGEQRTNTIMKALSRISKCAEQGKFNQHYVELNIKGIMNKLSALPKDFAIREIEKFKEDLAQAAIEGVSKPINSLDDETISALNIKDKNMIESLNQLLKNNNSTSTLHLSEKGNDVVVGSNSNGSVAIVPKDMLVTVKANDIIKIIANKKVDNLLNSFPEYVDTLTAIRQLYNSTYGMTATTNTAINALFTNSQFLTECLHTKNTNILTLIDKFIKMAETNLEQFDKHFSSKLEKQFALHKVKNFVALARNTYKSFVIDTDAQSYNERILTIEDIRYINNNNVRPLFNKAFAFTTQNGINVKFDSSKLTVDERQLLTNVLAKVRSDSKSVVRIDSLEHINTYKQISNIIKDYERITDKSSVKNGYLSESTQPNRMFNRYLKANNLTLQTLLQVKNDSDLNKANVFNTRKTEFENFTKNMFTIYLDITKNGPRISAEYTEANPFNTDMQQLVKQIDRATMRVGDKNVYFKADSKEQYLKNILRTDVDSSNISLEDVIRNPRLLNDNMREQLYKNKAVLSYQNGDMVDERIVMYTLRSEILKMSDGKTSIIELDDGTRCFADVTSFSDIVNIDYLKELTRSNDFSAINKNKLFKGIAANLNIHVIVDRKRNTNFSRENMTITLGKDIMSNLQVALDAVGHEVTHAIMYINRQQKGTSSRIVHNMISQLSNYAYGRIVERRLLDIIRAFEVYYPGISKDANNYIHQIKVDNNTGKIVYKNDTSKVCTQLELINDTLYYLCSGELSAYGLDLAVADAKFVPIVITDTHIILSNGHKCAITLDDTEEYYKQNYYTKASEQYSTDRLDKEKYTISKDIYNFIANNLDAYDDINKSFENMYITNNDKWSNMYTEAFDNFSKLQSREQMLNYIVNAQNDLLESDENPLPVISEDDRQVFLKLLHVQLAPTLSFEQFLNTKFPYIITSLNDIDISRTDIVTANVGSLSTNSFAKAIYDRLFTADGTEFEIGTITPSDVTMYLDPQTFTVALKLSNLRNTQQYYINTEYSDIIAYDKYLAKSMIVNSNNLKYNNTLIEDVEERVSLDEYEELDEKSFPRKPNATYTSRRIYRHKATGKLKYEYDREYSVGESNRQISKKLAGDTNLKYYIGAQISPDMQKFIVNATEQTAPDYMESIKTGTLSRSQLIKDFTFGRINNNKTFKLINDAFYKNSEVKSIDELNNLIANAPKVWATAIILKASNLNDDLLNLSPEMTQSVLDLLLKDTKLQSLYDKIYSSYETSYLTHKSIEIEDNYLRVLIMKYYDGTIESLRQIATVARSVASQGFSGTADYANTAVSINQQTEGRGKGDDKALSIADKLAGSDTQDILDYVDRDRDYMIEALLNDTLNKIHDASLKPGFNKDKYLKAYTKYKLALNDASDAQIEKQYYKLFKNELSAKHAEAKLDSTVADQETSLIEVAKRDVKRQSSNLARGISHQINTIKAHLSTRDQLKFLKNNNDIFNDDLSLKDEVIHDKDSAGRLIYKDIDTIRAVKHRIAKLSTDVRNNVYSSKKAIDYRKKLNKEIDKYKKQLMNTLAKPDKGTAVTFVEQDRSLTITVDKTVPPKLQTLLSYSLTKQADTSIKYLSENTEKHTVISLKHFINDNFDTLNSLSQEEVLDIVDFYLTAAPVSISDTARYTSLQLMILSYIYKSANEGTYMLDDDRLSNVYNRIKNIVSDAGTQLDTWKTVMKLFKPTEIRMDYFYKQYGVEVTSDQLAKMSKAFKDNDPVALAKVRKEVYDDMLKRNNKQYIKNKKSTEQATLQKLIGSDVAIDTPTTSRKNQFFNKVLEIERAFMLSGPGTWIRNTISNTAIGGLYIKDRQILPGLNTVSGKIGSFIAKLLPKKWQKSSQYKIVGTKVDDNVAKFIKANYLDNNFINMISDSVSKYDIRRVRKGRSTAEIYAELITSKLAQDVFNNNHKIAAAFNKVLSDDKYINRAAISYFGKILTESKIDLSKGMTHDVTSAFVDAYIMAASDFMHKTNFMHKIEEVIRVRFGDVGNFVYKQFFPFAASAVNWFSESLNYTPFGLIKSVVNFANLEKQIDKLDTARNRGERVPSSKFAQYITIRNIGKGVIGSIGMLIGGLLAYCGIVELDEEDDKYKLKAGNVSVDISEVFGTQGILLGMSVFGGIKDNAKFDTIIRQSFNTMFEDSLYTSVLNMFRYGSDNTYDNLKQYITYNIPAMFVPSMLKTITTISKKYDVQYSKGILGKIEKLAISAIPFLDRTMSKKIDPYTGNAQIAYNNWFLDVLLSKLGIVKFETSKMSVLEETALSLDIHKSQLSGMYTVNGVDIVLSTADIESVNKFYGNLNTKELSKLIDNLSKYSVQMENGSYKELKYSQMNIKQKAAVFERIMSNNSSLSKIYILTSTDKYKYYASDEEFAKLRKLGITKNVYRKTNKMQGFVKK